MTALKLSFDTQTLLRLTNEQYNQLTSTGETVIKIGRTIKNPPGDKYSRPFLAFDGSLSSYFFEFNPKDDINQFITNCYLTYFYPGAGKIKLVEGFNQPLDQFLLNKQNEIKDIPTIEKVKFTDDQIVFSDNLVTNSVEELLSTGNLKGQISCCDCGVEGCSSEYLWAKDYLGLVSFHVFAATLEKVCLYPFKLL